MRDSVRNLPAALRREPRGAMLRVRMRAADFQKAKAKAAAMDSTISEVVRRFLLGWIAEGDDEPSVSEVLARMSRKNFEEEVRRRAAKEGK